jgi:hypothetical protein
MKGAPEFIPKPVKISMTDIEKLVRKLDGQKENAGFSKSTRGKMRSAVAQLKQLLLDAKPSDAGKIEISPIQLDFLRSLADKSPNAITSGYSGPRKSWYY